MEIIKGKSILNKVAIGPILYHRKTESQVKRRTVEDTEAEVKRYEMAVACAEDELKTLHEKACEQVGETGAAVFEVHMMMLEDADYRDSVLNIIRNQKTNAEYAAAVTGDNFYRLFAFVFWFLIMFSTESIFPRTGGGCEGYHEPPCKDTLR